MTKNQPLCLKIRKNKCTQRIVRRRGALCISIAFTQWTHCQIIYPHVIHFDRKRNEKMHLRHFCRTFMTHTFRTQKTNICDVNLQHAFQKWIWYDAVARFAIQSLYPMDIIKSYISTWLIFHLAKRILHKSSGGTQIIINFCLLDAVVRFVFGVTYFICILKSHYESEITYMTANFWHAFHKMNMVRTDCQL